MNSFDSVQYINNLVKEVLIIQYYYPHFRLEKIRLRDGKLN